MNFNDWHFVDADGSTARVPTVYGHQWIAMRWDFGGLKGAKAAGDGVLELAIGDKYRAFIHWIGERR